MQQKSVHRFIYKIESERLRKAGWKLRLPLHDAMMYSPDTIVALNESQCLRFIDDINGGQDINEKVRSLQKKIRAVKKLPKSRETKKLIASHYDSLYNLQIQKDYVCVIMNSDSDYDRACAGFSIDYGADKEDIVTYRRLLGTSGGIKNSTIVFVNVDIYDELKKRLDCGRDKTKELVPAKLEAYQALICSGSTPIPFPKGVIVVDDCITRFKEDVILIDDSGEGEPKLTYEKDYEIEHNDSDGYGLMLPSYAQRVNEYLTGSTEVLSGMNTRYAWTKGMLYTFDFREFAEKVAGKYEVTDVWGHMHDVRNAEVILTTSMLKLWDSYQSWEDFYRNCEENHYQFATPKITPEELENVRDTNYQFLQSYEFTEDELEQLCAPTIQEIKDVLGLDYRKSLVFLAGYGLTDGNAFADSMDAYIKALLIDKRMINDSFIRKKIYHMIEKRIQAGKRGSLRIASNYSMISGDPVTLCENIFALKGHRGLKKGEVYHKYWIDKGADEISCFRAPMTCHNNIRRMKLSKDKELAYWYRYLNTVLVYNSFDSACEAMNGADKDGDTNMCTDNPIIVKNTKNPPTIICMQKKAEKKIPTEEDIIAANKIGFNDDIGAVTNHITSMIEVQAGYEPLSPEYKTLEYRIMCGQLHQQNVIDRIKGIIAKPMPKHWYSIRGCRIQEDDDAEIIQKKNFNAEIAATKKPYFMTYVYPRLKKENDAYIKDNNSGVVRRFGEYGINNIRELYAYENKTDEMISFLEYYEKHKVTGDNPCVVNRIAWIFEREFKNCLSRISKEIRASEKIEFDYTILKSGVGYSQKTYDDVYKIYKEYCRRVAQYQIHTKTEKVEKYEVLMKYKIFADFFQSECERVCPNEDELCDIVLDICYTKEKSKQFAWSICSQKIVENLLSKNGHSISYPQQVDDNGEFTYCGKQFIMCDKEVEVIKDDSV